MTRMVRPSRRATRTVVAALVLLGGLFFFNRMETTIADRV